MHILLAVLHSHPYCLRVLILFKYQVISSLVIISLIIMIFMFHQAEIRCWSLLVLKRLNHQQKDGVPFFSILEHLDSTPPKPTQDLVTLVHTLGLKSTHKSPHKKMICHYTIWLVATKIQLFSILVSIFFIVHVVKSTHTSEKKKLTYSQINR